MNEQQLRAQRLRVAMFVIATTALLITAVLVLGRSQSLFARKATLYASFKNTSGLIAGASVRLAGVDIGIVRSIHFDKDKKSKRVDVDLSIGAQYMERIRADSVAQIGSKGLLGDMIIDVTIGSAEKPQLHDKDHIESVEATGAAEIISTFQEAGKQVGAVAADVDANLKRLLTPEATADFQRMLHSAADVADGVQHGNGLVHALVYEPALADSTGQILADVQRIANHVDTSIAELQRLLVDARTGDGLVHGLIYDKKGGEAVAQLQEVITDLLSIANEVKSGHGLVHSLVYEEDKTNLIQNLSEVARIFRRLAEETAQGKGTIGGLLKDPTAYEDLTTALENLKRNDLLRALVRYTIVKDNLKRPDRVDQATEIPAR